MFIVMLNAVLAVIVSPFAGLKNLLEGMLPTPGMVPIGAGLHEPLVICRPLVIGRLPWVRQ